MLSKPLLAMLLAAAPSGAWAFGDQDCIGMEVCTVDGCSPSESTFNLSYDEANRSVTLTIDDQPNPRVFGDSNYDPDAPTDAAYFVNAETRAIVHVFWDAPTRIALIQYGAFHSAICTTREAA